VKVPEKSCARLRFTSYIKCTRKPPREAQLQKPGYGEMRWIILLLSLGVRNSLVSGGRCRRAVASPVKYDHSLKEMFVMPASSS
jgi:hypothetical protein